MKMSKFNVIVKIEEQAIVYNTLSGGVLKLEKEYVDELEKFQKTGVLGEGKFKENFLKGKMIVEDGFDEIKSLKAQNNVLRFSNQTYGLTLAPTMKCNFVCPYCYEKGRHLHTMTQDTIEKVKQLIRDIRKTTQTLSIAWYGGEPLLAVPIIEEISEVAIEAFGDAFYADMVTNGYLLDKRVAEKLKKLKIGNIQITIDGPPEIHNKMRRLPSGEDTLFVILENIKQALDIFPELKVNIRVNTDKSNIDRVDEVLDFLKSYELDHKVGVYLAPIDNLNNTCVASQCFTNNEFAEEQMSFITRNFKRGYNFINIPRPNLYICGATANNSCVIDAQGDVYKCWDDVGCKELRSGNLATGFELNENTIKWLAYDFLDDECEKCSFLPICMGGCPNHKIRGNNKKCTPLKNNAKELVCFMNDITMKGVTA